MIGVGNLHVNASGYASYAAMNIFYAIVVGSILMNELIQHLFIILYEFCKILIFNPL